MLKRSRKIVEQESEENKALFICILIIFVIATVFDFSYIDKSVKCKQITNRYCTSYEIEKYFD